MFFQSYEFVLAFLPITIIGYYATCRCKNISVSNLFLLIASILFYMLFNVHFILNIMVSILFNYALAYVLRKHTRLEILWIGILLNIAILAVFKYSNFFLMNMNAIFALDIPLLELLIPIGISFFTFQQISYLVDTYKKPTISYPLIEYALHILFFGYIISGPILRHNQIIPQFLDEKRKQFDAESFAKGLLAFTFGLAKKVLIADTFALAVNWGYENLGSLNATTAIFLIIGYTLQIYFDFSGYSDMVTGIGKMLHIDIPINFDSPYRSLSIIEFWKCWHITLTKFFTDYIYIPMGGNRRGTYFTYFNIFLVFFISGIWHGANWTFIIWGLLHGIMNMMNRRFKRQWDNVHPALAWLTTFVFINIAWVFFRANSIEDAIFILKTLCSFQFGAIPTDFVQMFMLSEFKFALQLFNITSIVVPAMIMGLFYILSIIGVLQVKNTNERMEQFKPTTIKAIGIALLLGYCILSFSGVSSFIYVNF